MCLLLKLHKALCPVSTELGVVGGGSWLYRTSIGFPGGTSGKEPACQHRRHERRGFDSYVGKIPSGGGRRGWAWQPTPVFLPGEPHGLRSPPGSKRVGPTEASEHACTWYLTSIRPGQGHRKELLREKDLWKSNTAARQSHKVSWTFDAQPLA